MDFLVTNLRKPVTVSEEALEASLRAHALTRWHGELEPRHFGSVRVYASGRALQAGAGETGGVCLLDGHALVNGRLVHTLDSEGHCPVDPGALRSGDVNGVFALFEINEKGSGRAFTDVTGQYPLFYMAERGYWFVGNNIHLLRVAAEAAGFHMRRALEPMAFTLATGAHFGNRGSFEGVQVLSPRSDLLLHPDSGVQMRRRASATDVYMEGEDYKSLVDATADDLRRTCRAILDLNAEQTVVDVTGGMDSRLCLAAFLAVSDPKDFSVFNHAPGTNPDRLVADWLVERYALQPAAVITSNQLHDIDPLQASSKGMFRYAGLRLKDLPDIGELVFPDVVRVSGGFGEFARGYIPNAALSALNEGGVALARAWVGRRGLAASFLTRDALEAVVTDVGSEADALMDEGIPRAQIDPVMYCENRCRWHFGIAYRFRNDVAKRLAPLNNLGLIRCAARIPDVPRVRANQVGFDLMRRLAGKRLTLEPYAGDKWNPALLPRWWRKRHEALSPVRPGAKPLARAPAQFSKRVLFRREHDSSGGVAREMRARGLDQRFQSTPFYQHLAEMAVAELDSRDRIWQVLDRERVLDAIRSDPRDLFEREGVNGRAMVGNLANLAHGLVWYLGWEEPVAPARHCTPNGEVLD